jgi:hypothetical protein
VLERDRLEECSYTYLPEGIHFLSLAAGTEKCVRECFAHLSSIFKEAPPNAPILILSDITHSGVPPLALLWRYSRGLLSQFPRHPLACDAIIHRQESKLFPAFVVVMEQLARLFGARVAFFREYERAEAIAWLLSQRRKNGG